jgi:pre-mRNA 3'-end-processing factor FIP1
MSSNESSSGSPDSESKNKEQKQQNGSEANHSSSSGSSSSGDEDYSVEDELEDDAVVLQSNVVESAVMDTVKRMYSSNVHAAPSGNYAAMRTNGEIFSQGSRRAWDLVNPSGVHPKDQNQPIFSYDLSALPDTVEAKPWTAPDADISDWFNYGFSEQTWEKYRKKMLSVIKNKKYEAKITLLSEQTETKKKRT